MPNLSKAQADLLAAEGWVKSHWRTIAIASLILNAVLIVWRLL